MENSHDTERYSEEEAEKRSQAPNRAFPDAFVLNYGGIIPNLTLPDPNDCHVLAAAIKSNANVIVTNNIKDFPKDYLNSFGVGIKTADDFLTDIIDLNHEVSIQAFREMVLHKKNPEMDVYQVLDQLRKSGLIDTANYLHSLLYYFLYLGKEENMASTTDKRKESLDERRRLIKAARNASARAYRISKALDLPVQVIKDGQIIEKSAHGFVKSIKTIKRVKSKMNLKKVTVLCLKPKG